LIKQKKNKRLVVIASATNSKLPAGQYVTVCAYDTIQNSCISDQLGSKKSTASECNLESAAD